MRIIFLYILAIVCTEATVEIVVKSNLFSWLRDKIQKCTLNFIKELISCGHCSSVWVSMFFTLYIFLFNDTGINSIPKALQIPIIWLFIHRLSNYLHMFIDRYVDKYYINNKD